MATIEIAPSCSFTRNADGTFAIEWDNGHAIKSVRGAAIDYVDPMFHMAVTRAGNELTYAPLHDLKRLTDGGIAASLAMVVVGMRKVCSSFQGVVLNIAEVTIVAETDAKGTLTADQWEVITKQAIAFKGLLDLAPTILGLNGLSLMLKGHNYIESDSVWSRLEAATDLESLVSNLGITDYSGTLYHDALHPFDAEWKVQLAADVGSEIVGHVNGVLIKRMPGVPAGTTLVFVTLAAIEQIKVLRPATIKVFGKFESELQKLASRIRNDPLDWCVVFQRAATAGNLAEVARIEALCAFIYGMCQALFDRKMSIMKSASFKNNANRHTAMAAVGKEWATEMAEAAITNKQVKKMLRDLMIAADMEVEDEDDDDDDDEEDDDA
jgi:hypothetical protein